MLLNSVRGTIAFVRTASVAACARWRNIEDRLPLRTGDARPLSLSVGGSGGIGISIFSANGSSGLGGRSRGLTSFSGSAASEGEGEVPQE